MAKQSATELSSTRATCAQIRGERTGRGWLEKIAFDCSQNAFWGAHQGLRRGVANMTGICVPRMRALPGLYVGSTSARTPPCSSSSPPSGSSSAVWFLRVPASQPASRRAVNLRRVFIHTTHFLHSSGSRVFACFLFRCLSLPPAIAHPPLPNPPLPAHLLTGSLSQPRAHTNTRTRARAGTCCASLDQIFRRVSPFVRFQLQNKLVFLGVF